MTPDLDKSRLLEQYKLLREEIMYMINKNMLFKGSVAVICTPMLTLVKDHADLYIPIVILYAFIVSLLSYHIFRYEKHTARNAAYMAIFLEPHLDEIQWETRLRKYEKTKLDTDKFKFNAIHHFLRILDKIYLEIIALFVIGDVIFFEQNVKYFYIIILLALSVILITQIYLNVHVKNLKEESVKLWQEVDKKEQEARRITSSENML